ncbi:hypothetical protein SAMN04515695_4866 [Pseudovibrio sp. Tun.PSC04-5.I4]|nr:hypothetical protein SAMN04515695_4866 [Pseudovibrio sp. Tun.PSC04-5.I4]
MVTRPFVFGDCCLSVQRLFPISGLIILRGSTMYVREKTIGPDKGIGDDQ